ncbi:MAG: hypothetical protein NC131_06405 [Roseburia sp.]|nr:hypothetical protein [Roseburia sp.]
MATLDSLDNRLSVLEGRVDSASSQIGTISDNIHNLDTRMDSAEAKLANHEGRIQTLELKVEDHERRLLLIELSHINYTVSRNVKYPKKADQGFYLYMPKDLTIDIMMQYNHSVVKQKWNWLNKIFNPNGYGKVSFDFDREDTRFIKTIVLGQNTRILIPTGITIQDFTPIKSVLKASNETDNSMYKGICYGIEVLGDSEELVISVFNPTSNIVPLRAGDILVQVLHLFSYHTVPQKVTPENP